jgi:hypothetical protein
MSKLPEVGSPEVATAASKDEKEGEDPEEEIAPQPVGPMGALEAYTKLLGPEAEKILRTTLGLPPIAAVASVADVEGPELMEAPEPPMLDLGPYNPEELRAKTLSMAANLTVDKTNDTQIIVTDCLVSDIDGYSELELAGLICDALDCREDMAAALEGEPLTLDSVAMYADSVASNLTELCGLPGDFVFAVRENDYCLLFAFGTDMLSEVNKMSQTLVTAATKKAKAKELPKGPAGVLTLPDQKEIGFLKSSKKRRVRDFSLKELKRGAPKLYSVVSKAITDSRNADDGLTALCDLLSSSVTAAIGQVYGTDGEAHYNAAK